MNPTARAKVRHSLLKAKKAPAAISTLENVCKAAAQCADVKNDVVAANALAALAALVTDARASLVARDAAATSLDAAKKTLALDMTLCKKALWTFETAVDAIADGDAALITKVGLLSRDPRITPAALSRVGVVTPKVGKNLCEAQIGWPAAPGATGYTVEVNMTPTDPNGPWTAHSTGTSRRRTLRGPTPGSQMLARVAALGSDGTRADWSDPVLVTTR